MGFSVKKGKLMKNLVILLFFCNFIVIYSFIIVWRYASWPQSNNSFKARCNSLWILYFSNKAKKMRLVVEYLRDNHDSVFKAYTCILLLGPFPHLHRCCGPRVGHQGLTLHDQRHAAWREIQLCPQDWQGGQSREDGTGNLTRLRCQRESVVRKICISHTQNTCQNC